MGWPLQSCSLGMLLSSIISNESVYCIYNTRHFARYVQSTYFRIRLGVHSVEQVCVGASIGSVLGLLWSRLAQCFFRPCVYPWLCNSRLGRHFALADWGAVPDPITLQTALSRAASRCAGGMGAAAALKGDAALLAVARQLVLDLEGPNAVHSE